MVHHRVVDELDAQNLPGQGLTIESPAVAIHVAGQTQSDIANARFVTSVMHERSGYHRLEECVGHEWTRSGCGGRPSLRINALNARRDARVHGVEIRASRIAGLEKLAFTEQDRGVAADVLGRGAKLYRPRFGWHRDDHVVGLRHPDQEPVDGHGAHTLPIASNDRHGSRSGGQVKVA